MGCLKIPEANYALFSEEVHDAAMRLRRPVNGTFALTYRCNLRCAHCYGFVEPAREELTTRQVCAILDQIADAGCLWLLLTGGEPLARKDFPEIYLHAKKKGFILALFTNGTLLTPAIADLLKDYPPFYIEISLYGATEATYQRVTGVSGAYGQCRRGIDLLLERKIPLDLKTVVTISNKDELWQIKRLAEDELGLEFRFDPIIRPKLNGSLEPAELRISPEDAVRLDIEDAARFREWTEFSRKFGQPRHSDSLFSCPAGQIMFEVDPYGELRACDMVRGRHFNLLAEPFEEGWGKYFADMATLKRKDKDSGCGKCFAKSFCDICPAWSELESGQEESAVDYLCKVARLRAEKFMAKSDKEVSWRKN